LWSTRKSTSVFVLRLRRPEVCDPRTCLRQACRAIP
jgi:hypothetical protein